MSESGSSLITIFMSMALINNFILAKFLGLCPFFGVSKKLSNAISMGAAVTLVMLMASVATTLIYRFILVSFKVEFMNIIIYILVISKSIYMYDIGIY